MKIIATTDIHGQLFAYNDATNEISLNGMPRLATFIQKYKSKNKNVLLIDNGDILQGTPLNTFTNNNQHPSYMAQGLNELNYDFFNLGNHDFNYGPEILMKYINTNQAKCLCCNVEYKGKPLGHSYIFQDENQQKIGIFGLVTTHVTRWEKASNILDFNFKDVIETANEQIKKLRNEVDIIICAYHGGFERDLVTGEASETLDGENVGYQLAQLDIDYLITGHQHRTIATSLFNTITAQCANNLEELMLFDLNKQSSDIVKLKDYDIDEEFNQKFQDIFIKVQQFLDSNLATLSSDCSINDVFMAQINKPKYITLFNKILLEYYQADFCFSSLFNNSIGLKQKVTRRDLLSSYPFPNTMCVLEMDYDLLIEYLEYNARYFKYNEDHSIGISDAYIYPKKQMYNYDLGDGLSYQINVSWPKGKRLSNLIIPKKEKYKVLINNYRVNGGGSFEMLQKAKRLFEDTKEVVEIIEEYMKNYTGIINVEYEQNIIVTK